MKRLLGCITLAFLLLSPLSAAAVADDVDELLAHLQKGRYGEAAELVEDLSEATRTAPRAALVISRLHRTRGETEQAIDVLNKALAVHEHHPRLTAALARLEFDRGNFVQAERLAREAIARSDDEPLAHWILGESYLARGRADEADEQYRWSVRFYNRTQPKDAETLMLVAHGAAQYARRSGANQIFGFIVNTLCPDALEADPNHWQAAWFSGLLLLEKYNRAEGIPELETALAINPHAPDVHAALAEVSLAKMDTDQAVKSARQALETNPRHIPAHRVLARVKMGAGDFYEALEDLERARAVNPSDQRTQGLIAACHLLLGAGPEPDGLTQLLDLADDPVRLKQRADSPFAETVAKMAAVNPRPGLFYTVIGEACANHRRFEFAELLFQQAIEVMPKLSIPRTGLGMLYMQTGRTADARKVLDAAFKADPFHVRVSNMRKVLNVLDGYDSITTDHFVVRVDPDRDRMLGAYMSEFLERRHAELVKQFGFEPPERTPFEIFHDAKGLSAHQWFSARMVGLPWIQTIGASTGMMVALESPNAVKKPFNWSRVLTHEYVHVITLQQSGFKMPHWFAEAIAMTAEGYPGPPQWDELLGTRAAAGDLQFLDELNVGFKRPKSPTDWQYAYCQSYLHARYIVESFGEGAISNLLNAYRDGLRTPDAIQRALGIDREDFVAGYRAFVGQFVDAVRAREIHVDEPIENITAALNQDPTNSKLQESYAWLLLQSGARDDARKAAARILEGNPRSVVASIVLADAVADAGQAKKAVDVLKQVDDTENPSLPVLVRLARLHLKLEQFADAAAYYERGWKADPHRNWLSGLAVCYLQQGEHEKLKAVLEQMTRLDSDDLASRQKLLELAIETQDDESVIRWGGAILEIAVHDVSAHSALAAACARKGDAKRALREARFALQLDPDDKVAQELVKSLTDDAE